MNLRDAVGYIRAKRSLGYRIVFTNGCFDLFHAGHLDVLRYAASLGDILMVGVNADRSVRKLKPGRPIVPCKERVEILEAIRYVDGAIPFSTLTPIPLIRKLKPDIHVKGGDWTKDAMPETRIVEGYGGRVIIFKHRVKVSTTSRIREIKVHG